MTYTQDFDPNEVPDNMTMVGLTSRQLVNIQESRQREVAESQEWLVAKRTNYVKEKYQKVDSCTELEKLGFKILREQDDLFYVVEPPPGWQKSTTGYWTRVVDETGAGRMEQFHKGAIYDRRAFINVF